MPAYRTRPPEDHELLCDLNESEILLKGKQLAEAESALEAAELEKAAAMKVFASRIDAAKGVARKLATEINSKQERRAVPCAWGVELYAGRDQWVLRREDTEAVVTTEPVTQADRQQELSLS